MLVLKVGCNANWKAIFLSEKKNKMLCAPGFRKHGKLTHCQDTQLQQLLGNF